MRTVLVMTIFVLGVFVTASAIPALSGPFVPLISEQIEDARDSDQPDNQRDVADSDNESPAMSATRVNNQ